MKFRIFTLILLLISGSVFSTPNAILGSGDPSALLLAQPGQKNQLYWWCHNVVNNPGKKPQPISLEGIVKGHWSNRFKNDGSPNPAHNLDHFASSTELSNNACGTITPPSPPPPCTSNCGHISGSDSFDFEIQMGGTDANVYVCQVGFGPSFCTEGCTGGDYMVVHKANGSDVTIYGPNDKRDFVKGELDGSSASVYLNSLNAGSSYYVKYCLDIERLIVGDQNLGPNDIYTLTAQTHAQVPIDLTAYLSTVGLNTKIYHNCGTQQEVISELNLDGYANLTTPGDFSVETQDIIPMNKTSTTSCAWKVLFTETNHCIRPIIHEGATSIHTELNFDLTCHEQQN